jgi:hypothetical protein
MFKLVLPIIPDASYLVHVFSRLPAFRRQFRKRLILLVMIPSSSHGVTKL